MAKQHPRNQRHLTSEDKRLLRAAARELHASWELSITLSEPCGSLKLLSDLRNFVKPNRPAVTWKNMGLSEDEAQQITDALVYHGIIEPRKRKKRNQQYYRRNFA